MKLDTDIVRGKLLGFQSTLDVVPVLDRCFILPFKARIAVRSEDFGGIVISPFVKDLSFNISNIM